MTHIDRAVGLLVAMITTLGLAWASTVSTTPPHASEAVLRLAWSARPERIEDCRPQSDEALAKLPPHMRQAMICEGTTAEYRLEVWRNDVRLLEETVRGGGLRHDRALYVFREMTLPPGDATLTVRFERTGVGRRPDAVEHDAAPSANIDREREAAGASTTSATMSEGRRRREDEERRLTRSEAIPASLSLERRVHVLRGRVILVTYDPERRELLLREGGEDTSGESRR